MDNREERKILGKLIVSEVSLVFVLCRFCFLFGILAVFFLLEVVRLVISFIWYVLFCLLFLLSVDYL